MTSPIRRAAEPRHIFAFLVASLAAYEFYALTRNRNGDTISEIIWSLSRRWGIFPFLAGLTAGHLFWQTPSAREPTTTKP